MTKDLTVGNPFKVILLMSLPIMAGNFFQQFYSIVDMIIVGRLLGSNSLAAVGSSTSIYYLVMWFVCSSAGGFAIVLAQYFGAGDMENLRKGVCTALELSITITLGISVVCLIFLKGFLRIMNTPEEIFAEAYSYIFVIIAGMLCTMLYNIAAAILRAMGDSKTPLYFLIFSSFLNIFLDIVCIKYLNMGVRGAAVATIFSQGLSALLSLAFMYMHFKEVRVKRTDWKFDTERACKMLYYGIPAGFCGVLTAIGILILQFAINCYGTTVIAGYTAAIKVQNFTDITVAAYSTTMVNFIGQNVGAGKYDNARKGYRCCIALGVVTDLVCGALLFVFGGALSSLFVTGDGAAGVIDFAARYLRYTGIVYAVYPVLLGTRSALQGLGDSAAPVISGLVESAFRALWVVYLVRNYNITLLCLVNPTVWIITAIAMVLIYEYRWKRINSQASQLGGKV